MDVEIKDFNVEMKVKNKGIKFSVRDPNNGRHKGNCYLTKTEITWCRGKTAKSNGKTVTWEDFICWMNDK